MARRQLFIIDPIEQFDPDHDTSYLIMRAAESRGYEVWCCRSVDLRWEKGALRGQLRRVSVLDSGPDYPHFSELEYSDLKIDSFDLVWMREDPPFDSQYLYSTYLLEQVSAPVINSPQGLRDCNEKLFILEFPDLIPATWVGANIDQARQFIEKMDGVAVAKTLSGYGGEEVYRVETDSPRSDRILNEITCAGEQTIMLQEFLPAVMQQGDRRIIVVDGEPVGGLTRLPAPGDFRSNLHSGGSAEQAFVSDTEREICARIKDKLLQRGLFLVGLDLVDNKITEINVTSPTCVQEINRLAAVHLEEKIMDCALDWGSKLQ